LSHYSRPRAGGIIALGLEEGDELVGVNLCRQGQHIILGTTNGMSIRFDEADARAMGRSAVGVWGIRLEDGDEVCDMVVTDGDGTLLTVCENGYGKRTLVEEYRVQSRGGKGIIDIRTTERNGKVVNLLAVGDDDEVIGRRHQRHRPQHAGRSLHLAQRRRQAGQRRAHSERRTRGDRRAGRRPGQGVIEWRATSGG
jgi:DNA gyrase/topoisomerase IV subunit A